MRLENLPKSKETKVSKRVGRGPGSGMGKTATRGENGQKSRSGASIPAWFQGGQTPLHRRIPMRGFNNKNFAKRYACVNVGDLEAFEANAVIDQELLYQTRFIGKRSEYGLKVLGNGEITKPLTIRCAKATKQAREKIEKVGGKIEEL